MVNVTQTLKKIYALYVQIAMLCYIKPIGHNV